MQRLERRSKGYYWCFLLWKLSVQILSGMRPFLRPTMRYLRADWPPVCLTAPACASLRRFGVIRRRRRGRTAWRIGKESTIRFVMLIAQQPQLCLPCAFRLFLTFSAYETRGAKIWRVRCQRVSGRRGLHPLYPNGGRGRAARHVNSPNSQPTVGCSMYGYIIAENSLRVACTGNSHVDGALAARALQAVTSTSSTALLRTPAPAPAAPVLGLACEPG